MNYYAVEDPLNSNPPTTNPETATFEGKEEPDLPINPNKLPPIHNNRQKVKKPADVQLPILS